MNFVFDIGNVLVDFRPESFLRALLNCPDMEAKMNALIFKSPQWLQLDAGTITQAQAYDAFCAAAPADRDVIRNVMDHLPDMLTPIPDTIALLPVIQAAGHNLYYLSNSQAELSRYIREQYEFFKLFDGGVFSCDVHLIKPSAEIYRYFLKKYQLNAGDCLFFDDAKANVEAADRVGMHGVLFRGARDVRRFLQ